jgi:aspartate/methionine/tyrosine aminotransferase
MKRVMASEYLEWAKSTAPRRWSLAASGMPNQPLSVLPVRLDELAINGPGGYGHAPLVEGLAARAGVAAERLVTATGTSMANYVAMAALVEPGDEVLIERPTYEPLLGLASYLGARITRFDRHAQAGFAVDPEAVAAALTPRTRLVVLTNLHNPSGALTDGATLRRVGQHAAAAGARVLVDEVYLDAVFDEPATSAASLGDSFVVTSSLTKVYGLSGLRCGWIIAAPELARRMWRLGDLHENHTPFIAQQLSVLALSQLATLGAATRACLAAGRARLDRFFDSRDDLSVARPRHGTIAFPRLLADSGDGRAVERLDALLRDRYDTLIVPGAHFEAPAHFRLGIGMAPELLEEALSRLAAALDDLRRAPP